jgi:hypothetical protein
MHMLGHKDGKPDVVQLTAEAFLPGLTQGPEQHTGSLQAERSQSQRWERMCLFSSFTQSHPPGIAPSTREKRNKRNLSELFMESLYQRTTETAEVSVLIWQLSREKAISAQLEWLP